MTVNFNDFVKILLSDVTNKYAKKKVLVAISPGGFGILSNEPKNSPYMLQAYKKYKNLISQSRPNQFHFTLKVKSTNYLPNLVYKDIGTLKTQCESNKIWV